MGITVEAQAAINRLRQFKNDVERAVDPSLAEAARYAAGEVKDGVPVDTGQMRASVTIEQRGKFALFVTIPRRFFDFYYPLFHRGRVRAIVKKIAPRTLAIMRRQILRRVNL